MAKLALPNADVLAAMEDLGLAGWLPNVRPRARSRRDSAPLRAERGASEISFTRRRAVAEPAPGRVQAVQTMGLVLAAAGATALLVHGADSAGGASRSSRGGHSVAGVLATAAVVGLGALATFAANAMRGAWRR